MTRRRRKDSEIARDLKRTAEMYLRGYSQSQIADELGVTQATISNDLAALHSLWLEQAVKDFDTLKERELSRIDALEREYWEAWEKSKKPYRANETKRSEGRTLRGIPTNGFERSRKVEARIGDPRYLAGVQWCIEKRIAIFGLQAAKNDNLNHLIEVVITYAGTSSNNDPISLPSPSRYYAERGALQSGSDGAADRENDPSDDPSD